MRTRSDAKVNREIKHFNKELREDVFGGRFWVHQTEKSRCEGITYYRYELIDEAQPQRNYIIPGWLNEFDFERKVWGEMNNFIVRSNFWSIYNNKPEQYNEEMDIYLKNHLI